MYRRLAGFAALLALAACTGNDQVDTDTDGPGPVPTCFDGLEAQPFQTEGTGVLFGDVAGDYTLNLLDGTRWTWSANHTGCEVTVFLVYYPGYSTSEQMFASVPSLLLETDENVRYVFLSDDVDESARVSRMSALQSDLASAGLAWKDRLLFATDRPRQVIGSVGEMNSDYQTFANNPDNAVDLGDRGRAGAPKLVAFGIDRQQQWDPGGSMSEVVGGSASFRMPSYLGMFYNYKARLAAQVEATPSTEVTLVDETSTERVLDRTVTLPDAATMADFDTMEFDVELVCNERNPFACSEWDRIAHIELCTDGPDCAERLEVGRWITQYWRRGQRRWVIDATPFLGLVSGGEQTFRVTTGPTWERATERDVRVALRLRTEGGQPVSTGVQRAFTGGTFDASYNDRDGFEFTPPASATRVEVVHILSGHGQTSGDNCAEWCDHRHIFTINGTDLPEVASEAGIGSRAGCAVYAAEGVPPGQWGNWAPQRAYWCPGLPVPAERLDITDQVTMGSTNTLEYRGKFRNGEPRGGSIALSAYVVWYED